MAKTPLDSDIRRLPVTVGLLAGVIVSLGSVFSGAVWFQSWVDSRVSAGVSHYSNELIYPRVEKLESAQRRIISAIESQELTRSKQHEETINLLKQISGGRK